MANLRDLRRRIKSVKNTAQITKAMQLVAASKMKRAQDQAVSGRPYAESLNKILNKLKSRAEDLEHPLLEQREGDRELMVVVNTDKGLCGGLNTNLLRKTLNESGPGTRFVTVGSKLLTTLARLKKDLQADFQIKDPVHFSDAKAVARFVTDQYLEGHVDRVRVAFTNFVSTLTQAPTVETLLPISPLELGAPKDFDMTAGKPAPVDAADKFVTGGDYSYLYEPDPSSVFVALLPQYINYTFYQMVLEARASEHSSRMVAMKNATDNAKQLIKDLTLEYNKARQAAITSELLEIATAQMAIN